MKFIQRAAGVLGLLSIAGIARADVTSTITLTNDYDFRGISQSAKDPALQASIDYAHESGFYVGVWASNVDFPAADSLKEVDYEIDVYAGFSRTLEDQGVTWDLGVVTYNYPDEADYNYFELYGSVEKDWFKGKLWYSPDYGGDTSRGDTEAWYLEANGTFPLPQNFSVLVHAGYSAGDYWDKQLSGEVLDYSVGLGYAAGKFDLALKYQDQDSDFTTRDDAFNSEGRVIFTVATKLPWKD